MAVLTLCSEFRSGNGEVGAFNRFWEGRADQLVTVAHHVPVRGCGGQYGTNQRVSIAFDYQRATDGCVSDCGCVQGHRDDVKHLSTTSQSMLEKRLESGFYLFDVISD